MDDHPGGVDILRMHAGDDASREFDNVGHSANALKQLESLIVGSLMTS
jgi:cytochrome b involved in lipid metabolism